MFEKEMEKWNTRCEMVIKNREARVQAQLAREETRLKEEAEEQFRKKVEPLNRLIVEQRVCEQAAQQALMHDSSIGASEKEQLIAIIKDAKEKIEKVYEASLAAEQEREMQFKTARERAMKKEMVFRIEAEKEISFPPKPESHSL